MSTVLATVISNSNKQIKMGAEVVEVYCLRKVIAHLT